MRQVGPARLTQHTRILEMRPAVGLVEMKAGHPATQPICQPIGIRRPRPATISIKQGTIEMIARLIGNISDRADYRDANRPDALRIADIRPIPQSGGRPFFSYSIIFPAISVAEKNILLRRTGRNRGVKI